MLQEFTKRQHSIFTLAQAIESGFTCPRIRRKVRVGEWDEVEPRTYRLAAAGLLDWRGLRLWPARRHSSPAHRSGVACAGA